MKTNFNLFLLKISIILILSIVTISCSSSKQAKTSTVARTQAKFDYSPEGIEKVGTSNITIALINPSYSDQSLKGALFDEFSNSMAKDMEELLTKKGYKIRSFSQIGDMLYNDKENSDFVVKMEVDLNFQNVQRKSKRLIKKPSFGQRMIDPTTPATVSYQFEAQGTFFSRINLIFQSTKYSEKLRAPSVTSDVTPLKYVGSEFWAGSEVSFFNEVDQDNVVYNALATALMSQYDIIFKKIDKQLFEIQEMQDIKTEAHKVDKKN
ncbi:MAG: HpaA family protein [Saprospiraceae bacterium]|nr:HpaA family protein [Saprospiraceae bacterium]